MPNILIPVDFTLNCHNAYAYGLKLAEAVGLDVLLVHYYISSVEPGQPLVFSGDGSIRGSFLHRLEQFANPAGEGFDYPLAEPPQGVNVAYETSSVFSISAAILKRAQQGDVELVVMANRSTRGIFDRWLGSISITISESCNRPIFLIPEEAQYREIKRIVVANHHETAEPYPLWQIEILKEFTNAEVHFVHVEHPTKPAAMKFVPWKLMGELDNYGSNQAPPFTIVTVNDQKVARGLINYADQIDANLTVIVNRLRAHWRAIVYAGNTQDIALRSKRPLLILHTDITRKIKLDGTLT